MIREIISVKGGDFVEVCKKMVEYKRKYPTEGYGTQFKLKIERDNIDVICERYESCE